MSTFSSQCVEPAATPPDPRKHVNYVHGMVLGVDDLQQDFAYHQHQNHWLSRDAIGYGTLSGLKVEVQGTQISVAAGTALSPRGQLIRVEPRQCASLDAWLRLPETQQRLPGLGVAAASSFTAYLVLCFRDCKTDPLPIPGEPCRCDSEAMAPSRITDDFRLELRLEPPAQREENAIRDFVEWLRRIRTTSDESVYSSIEDFVQAIRDAARDLASPLESPPDFLYGSPPENLVIPCCHLCEYLRAALHLWVTELRPMWQVRWRAKVGDACGCHGEEYDEGKDAEECLFLAALHVTLGGSTTTVGNVQVDDSRRPLVVHLRMLQELLLCSRGAACCNDRTFATLFALDQTTLRVWVHHPSIVSFTESALRLEINGESLSGFTVANVDHNVFDILLGESPPVPLINGQRIMVRFDTRLIVENTSPPRTLAEAIRQGCICFPNLADDFITVFGAVVQSESGSMLAGDATGPVHSNTVEGIQNFPVDVVTGPVPPDGAPVLGFNGAKWQLTGIRFSTRNPTNIDSANASSPGAIDATKMEFARADHVHALGRVVLGHVAIPDPPGSDVRGILGRNKVVGLEGVPLANPNLTPTEDRFVLTYRQPTVAAAGKWVAEAATGGATFQTTTGTVTFRDVRPNELRVSKPLPHRIPGAKHVCVRLGLEIPPQRSGVIYDEDTDSFFPIMSIMTPTMVARFDESQPDLFQILLRGAAQQRGARDWVVRWWAFPATHVSDDIFTPAQNDPLPRDLG